jgi:predicted nuclease of restriction endonuclease-like (RecB) superfamily
LTEHIASPVGSAQLIIRFNSDSIDERRGDMLSNTTEYLSVVNEIKEQIISAQQRAAAGINREMVALYWNVGKRINDRKTWGDSFIPNLARDIRYAFPALRGFSERNLKYMAKFARIYSDVEIVQQVLHNLPWRHNIALMDKLDDEKQRIWYGEQALENGWSSSILELQIESKLYERQVIADKTTNFKVKLPDPQSDMAQQALKDPYIFDFIETRRGMVERDVENELVGNIAQFLLELGSGFAFVGRQYHLEIGDKDFYIDLLFYNLKLRCYVVIELKMNEFIPEFAGKLNFYVSAVDDMLKQGTDNPTIGILLCKKKNKVIAEYALRHIDSPISVNEFKLFDTLPKEYADVLPSAEDIENRLNLEEIEEDDDAEIRD